RRERDARQRRQHFAHRQQVLLIHDLARNERDRLRRLEQRCRVARLQAVLAPLADDLDDIGGRVGLRAILPFGGLLRLHGPGREARGAQPSACPTRTARKAANPRFRRLGTHDRPLWMQMRFVLIINIERSNATHSQQNLGAKPAHSRYESGATIERGSGVTTFGGAMSTRVTALSVVAFMAGGLASSATLAQTSTEPYAVPRTSWGDPDLQGVWDYRTITPMERRPELGDRAFYTEEEVAQLEGRAARRMDKPPDEN